MVLRWRQQACHSQRYSDSEITVNRCRKLQLTHGQFVSHHQLLILRLLLSWCTSGTREESKRSHNKSKVLLQYLWPLDNILAAHWALTVVRPRVSHRWPRMNVVALLPLLKKEMMFSGESACFYPFVCLFVHWITQKALSGFWWHCLAW